MEGNATSNAWHHRGQQSPNTNLGNKLYLPLSCRSLWTHIPSLPVCVCVVCFPNELSASENYKMSSASITNLTTVHHRLRFLSWMWDVHASTWFEPSNQEPAWITILSICNNSTLDPSRLHSNGHNQKVHMHMVDLMSSIICEGDTVSQELLDTVLVNLVPAHKVCMQSHKEWRTVTHTHTHTLWI